MTRRKTPFVGNFPYHVSARTNNQDWFGLPMQESWRIFQSELSSACENYRCEIIAFVLMSNHFHLLIRTPDSNLGRIMNYVMRETSREFNRRLNRKDHVYGGTYRRSLIRTESYLAHAYKYVYRNPVEAGLCESADEYPYSTLQTLLHGVPAGFPIFDEIAVMHSTIPSGILDRVEWINTPYAKKQKAIIRRALRRVEFSISPKGTKYLSSLPKGT